MKAIRIPLQPHSHFHFGEFKVDSNVALSSTSVLAHSDTLFSALVNSYQHGTGDAADFVNDFEAGNVTISSLFYYLKKGEYIIYLLPKPVFLDLYSPRDGHHKLRNQIKFVSVDVWEQGFNTAEWMNDDKYAFFQNHDILLTKSEFSTMGLNDRDFLYKIVDIPKSPIRKNNPDDSIYYQADVEIGYIQDVEIGFFFMYNSCSECENRLKYALSIMANSGIGGERNNTGRSMHEPVFEAEINIELKENGNKGFTNVSLLNPRNAAELEEITYYQSIFRGGRKNGKEHNDYKVVRMIHEGALLEKETIKGRLVLIGSDEDNHEVYRNGLAIILPLTYFKSNE